MKDLIERQAAIDALDGEIEITGRTNAEAVKGYVRLVRDRLERLPSAQPEIIRCKECKHYEGGWYCSAWNNSPGFPIVTEKGYCNLAERRTDAETEV